MAEVTVAVRNAIRVGGVPGGRPMLFAHGFGCDQAMWRFVAPGFEGDPPVVLFDHVGAGEADPSAHEPQKDGAPRGYATDGVRICRALGPRDGVFVGDSVGSVIG